jgi:predicted O-methyltransferase YrrM
MYSLIQLVLKYCSYYFKAANGKGHGVHSPFVYELITKVLNDDRIFYSFEQIEQLRSDLLKNQETITVEDFGAGSRVKKMPTRTIAEIANSSLKPKKYGQLLFKLVHYFAPKVVVELGTSLGITTAYLATANENSQVITMEGSTEVAAIAMNNFKQLSIHNIELVTGNFDLRLTNTLDKLTQVDFAFLDGNHRYEPTIRYFEQVLAKSNEYTIVVLDDIHWSKEMEDAWDYVQQHEAVTLTIDLFYIGLVFFRKEKLAKQHFIIRY